MARFRIVKRDYWDNSGSHRPYQNVPHGPDDEQDGAPNLGKAIMGDFADGDILEIEVRKVGRVEGFYQLTKPHTYTRVETLKKGDA